MDWRKELPRSAGGSGGWRDDFPLDHDLPTDLQLDCGKLELPIHPMFALRLRVFVDWHRSNGRQVLVTPPSDPLARRVFLSMQLDPETDLGAEDDAIVPVTRMKEFAEVEHVAEMTQEILEYQLPDVAPLGHATFMAVSELCNNAIDHGENALGAYAAVRRVTEPRKQVTIAISDLGMGMPEHIRQQYPEWGDDGWAIAHAHERGSLGHWRSTPRIWLLRSDGSRADQLPACGSDRHLVGKRVLPVAERPRNSEGRRIPAYAVQARNLDHLRSRLSVSFRCTA